MPKMTRRTFLWVTGGSGVALAADPPRKLVNKLIPQVIPPERIEPGEWSLFATTCRECPAGCGMHLWHRDGRVTKAEGNPLHPVNRGGLCPRGQSALQGLYDPDRVRGVMYRDRGGKMAAGSWEEAFRTIGGRLAAGGRVALLSSLQTGALAEVMRDFAATFGSERLLFYEPFGYEPLKVAHRELFGLPVVPSYRLEQCNLIISFAADFLESWISPVSYASQFGEMHGYRDTPAMNRMVYVGPRLSMTAANADRFIQVPPGSERLVALALVKLISERGWAKNDLSAVKTTLAGVDPGAIPGVTGGQLTELARSFMAGTSVALAGPVGASGNVAAGTAAAVALLNHAAGMTGRTVDFSRPHALSGTASEAELESFFGSLTATDILFIHDTNILYSRPRAAAHVNRAGLTICLGTMADETAEEAHWLLPIDSPLESWGDYEPEAGINGLLQPTMNRLHDSRGAGDILLELARRGGKPLSRAPGSAPAADFHNWLEARWAELRRQVAPAVSPEVFWQDALGNGGAWKEAGPPARVALRAGTAGLIAAAATSGGVAAPDAGTAELWPWASIMLFDGRPANRGWIQEAPDPVTQVAWGDWLDIHPANAARLELNPNDIAEVVTTAGSIEAMVRITPEVSEQLVAISFGQGHRALGRNARGIGANAFALLGAPEEASMFTTCRIRRIGARDEKTPALASPTREQFHREIVQWVGLSKMPGAGAGGGQEFILPLPEGYRPERDLYPKRNYLAHRWAMVIDLQRCIGCGACAIACYAENNVAVMGREEVRRQHEMAWLRVVPYRKQDVPMRFSWLPMLCQHCDAAPCEPVCPVYAAVHNEEGLNSQIYNRCIGTRYCANNCPYKVRRFNWLNNTWHKPLDLQLNPEVTVRVRGVMEKCTFCIQRIRQAEYRAKRENRPIRDGEIQPACAQSCPTRVYTFGDLLDPEARVTRLARSDPRRYQVLAGLNTKTAVIYLRKVDADA